MVVQLMATIDPKLRPSAASLTHHSILCPFRRKSRAQLCRELNEEKMKNQLLSRWVHLSLSHMLSSFEVLVVTVYCVFMCIMHHISCHVIDHKWQNCLKVGTDNFGFKMPNTTYFTAR